MKCGPIKAHKASRETITYMEIKFILQELWILLNESIVKVVHLAEIVTFDILNSYFRVKL